MRVLLDSNAYSALMRGHREVVALVREVLGDPAHLSAGAAA